MTVTWRTRSAGFVQRQPAVQAVLKQRQREATSRPDPAPPRGRSGPEIGR